MALVVALCIALKKHYSAMEKINRMPSSELVTLTGERFSLNDLRPERKTAFLFFSPDCEFCRKEIEGITANSESFQGIVWVFVTLPPIEDLESFLSDYPLESIPESKVCIDETLELFDSLDVTAPPSLFVYDAQGNLEHYNRGAVSIKTILEWMK